MLINTNAIVSVTEANQNFSQITRMVDEQGPVLIMKNNKPRYILIQYDEEAFSGASFASDSLVNELMLGLATKHSQAFKALAK